MTTADPGLTAVEQGIRRVLAIGTWTGITLLVVGTGLMLAAGVSPMAQTFPTFDLAQIVPDLLALRPEGFLWAGVVVFVLTPIARVVGELVLYLRNDETTMALVAVGILAVVGLSVVVALVIEV